MAAKYFSPSNLFLLNKDETRKQVCPSCLTGKTVDNGDHNRLCENQRQILKYCKGLCYIQLSSTSLCEERFEVSVSFNTFASRAVSIKVPSIRVCVCVCCVFCSFSPFLLLNPHPYPILTDHLSPSPG